MLGQGEPVSGHKEYEIVSLVVNDKNLPWFSQVTDLVSFQWFLFSNYQTHKTFIKNKRLRAMYFLNCTATHGHSHIELLSSFWRQNDSDSDWLIARLMTRNLCRFWSNFHPDQWSGTGLLNKNVSDTNFFCLCSFEFHVFLYNTF